MAVRFEAPEMADAALIVVALAVLAGRTTDETGRDRCLRLAKNIADTLTDLPGQQAEREAAA